MKQFTNEVKIGIFIVVSLAIGAGFWVKTQNFSADTYTLRAYFNYAGGLKENSQVMLSGIEVGRITKISFRYGDETKVEVIMTIRKDAKVRTDSIAYIGTTGFIGNPFVGLTCGKTNSFKKNNDIVSSEDPYEMRVLMSKADDISKKLDLALVDVKRLAQNLNSTVTDNRNKIDNIIVNLEKTSVNFNEFSADIKKNPWKLLNKK